MICQTRQEPAILVVVSHRQHGGGGPGVRQDVDSGVAELAGDPDRPRAWTLLVDGIPQSHVDLDDPQYLEFGYMRRLGHLIDLAAPAGEPVRVLHLGGGGLTLARYVAAIYPASHSSAGSRNRFPRQSSTSQAIDSDPVATPEKP